MRMVLTPEDEAREKRWADDLKYHAARGIWFKRNERTPSGKSTWLMWLEKKFSDSYMDYVAAKKEEKAQPKTASLFDDQ